MEFSENKPIYKQIVEHFYSNILTEKWKEEERVPSVREIAVLIEVNPNTAMRAFHELQENDILYNKRGVGYFVSKNALKKVKEIKRQEFLDIKLPNLFKDMKQLDISFEELRDLHSSLKT
ncbi:MAG: GntR family transcriptional regulator [Balneola sp.]